MGLYGPGAAGPRDDTNPWPEGEYNEAGLLYGTRNFSNSIVFLSQTSIFSHNIMPVTVIGSEIRVFKRKDLQIEQI